MTIWYTVSGQVEFDEVAYFHGRRIDSRHIHMTTNCCRYRKNIALTSLVFRNLTLYDANSANNVDVDELVRHYLSLDFAVSDTCGFLLFIHHIDISERIITRILRKLGLKRRGLESSLKDSKTSLEKYLSYKGLG